MLDHDLFPIDGNNDEWTQLAREGRLHFVPAGRLVVYLASDEHSLVGQIISPNGGVVI